MAGIPWMKFYPADWIKDPALSMCSPATRGIWIDLICAMHQADDATLKSTPAKLARLARCLPDEMLAALSELADEGAADVAFGCDMSRACHADVTVTSRRVGRDIKARKSSRDRKQRSRANQAGSDCHGDVTVMSRESHAVEVRGQRSETDKTKSGATATDFPDALDSPEFRTAWTEWITYRRERRASLTPTTIRKQLNKLAKHPEHAAAALTLSMEQGWLGVFPERMTANGQHRPDRAEADRQRRADRECPEPERPLPLL